MNGPGSRVIDSEVCSSLGTVAPRLEAQELQEGSGLTNHNDMLPGPSTATGSTTLPSLPVNLDDGPELRLVKTEDSISVSEQ